MNRRQFLGTSLAGAAAASLLDIQPAQAQVRPSPAQFSRSSFRPPARSPLYKDGKWQEPLRAIRGVNLGAWLILEKWMTPSVFAGTEAHDEYTFSQLPDGREKIERHRETFITEDDFRWIADYGLDAVRLPVGYWALSDQKPYFSAAKYVQCAFDWAQKYDLKVLLDLHGAQGSQNGNDHSGRSGETNWPRPENRAATLGTLKQLADAYGQHPNLWGFQLLNEPSWNVPLDTLRSFYSEAYQSVRPKLPAHVAVVIHDGFRPAAWQGYAPPPEYSNVVLDTHMYQIFTETDRKRTPTEQVAFALQRREEIERLRGGPWLIVGEWSIAHPWDEAKAKTPLDRDSLRLGMASAQLLAFENTHGWFYWSYKTEYGGEWSFRDCVARGWLPSSMALA